MASKANIERLLGDFAVAVINMTDKPNGINDARLKEAVKKLAETLSKIGPLT